MKSIPIIAASVLAAVALSPVVANSQPNGDRVGLLACTVDGGIGLLLGSSKTVNCEFTHSDGRIESYTGTISKLGLDVGITGKSYIKWIVFTATGVELPEHPLAGSYVGVSTGASLGIGLGANALVGGNDKQIGLQPLSVEGQTGLNVAVAVSKLSLSAAN